jgi:hypothetical protein
MEPTPQPSAPVVMVVEEEEGEEEMDLEVLLDEDLFGKVRGCM